MKKTLIIVLQIIIVLIGIAVLAFMLYEPHLEGRNVGATLFQIYFNDPFLAYVYASSILFFVALYQAFKFVGYAGSNEGLSQYSVKAARTIKYCFAALTLLIAGALSYIFITMRGKDDIAGGMAIGLFMIFISIVVAITASVFEGRLQAANR